MFFWLHGKDLLDALHVQYMYSTLFLAYMYMYMYTLSLSLLFFRSHFPSEAVHTLREHSDEIWYLQFSHDGTRLASGCKDGQVFIWTIEVHVHVYACTVHAVKLAIQMSDRTKDNVYQCIGH